MMRFCPQKIMKTKLKKLLPLAAVLLLFAAASFLIYFNGDRIFVFVENAGLFRDEVAFDKTEGELRTVRFSIAELETDSRVNFDQSLLLINTVYTLPKDFAPDIGEYKDTEVFMNRCALDAYARLSAAVTEESEKKLYVSSDFRDAEEQARLYLEDPTTATLPGASEHQSGLCLDVYVAYFAGDGFLRSPAGRFVNRSCHEYGFIIRYPSYGEDVTGIRFEPWHIRYVGQPHADIIYGNRLTLEEYILSMEIGAWYEADGYLICRQSLSEGGTLTLPAAFSSCVISPDNTGCYIVTVAP